MKEENKSMRREEAMRETEKKLEHLMSGEIILPDQLLAGARRDSHASGERALMLAVLEDGIRMFQEHLTNLRMNPGRLARQAEDWIRADDWDWPYSFNNVCENLCIDPEALRKALLDWKERRRNVNIPSERTARIYRLHLNTKRGRRKI